MFPDRIGLRQGVDTFSGRFTATGCRLHPSEDGGRARTGSAACSERQAGPSRPVFAARPSDGPRADKVAAQRSCLKVYFRSNAVLDFFCREGLLIVVFAVL